MKRLIYGMMVVLITAISCEKNDIKGYNEAPRLEFFNTKAECVFDDRDYINEVTERALGVKVRCLGYALEKPLNFCLKTVDQMEGVVFIPSYEFPVGAETFTAQLVVPRPPRVGAQLNTKLTFDIENAEHDFGGGTCGEFGLVKLLSLIRYVLQIGMRGCGGYTVIINICL